MHGFRIASVWALSIATASAFQATGTASNRTPSPSALSLLQRHRPRPDRHPSILQQSDHIAEEEEYEMVEFFVSPEQISLLRKEATKRESRQKLPNFFLPPDESMEVSDETIDEISSLFETSELIEIRGVSKDRKRQVFDTAHGLALVLEDAMEKPVVVVNIKGFAVKLYCPWDDEKQGKRIQLRTSYKPGQCTRKAKPIRDSGDRLS